LAENELSPEEADAAELLQRLTVTDLVLSMLASAVQLGYAKLGEGELEQTQLAIETLRAVCPALEGAVPEDAVRDLRQATANLQLAYASKLNETSTHEEGEA
jgi:hypothetical protein